MLCTQYKSLDDIQTSTNILSNCDLDLNIFISQPQFFWQVKLYQHVCNATLKADQSGATSYLRHSTYIHRSGCWSPTQISEYVNTRRTIHPPIHSWWPSVPCGCCTCLEFLATQCSSRSSLASFCLHLNTHLFAASFPRWHSMPS